jgi:hypothetical protein
MTTNRPFFSNFLSAFRARSGIQKASTSPTGGVSGASLSSAYAQAQAAQQAQQQQQSNFSTAVSRTGTTNAVTTTKSTQTTQGATATRPIDASSQLTRRQYHSTSPYSRSPGSPGPGLRPLTNTNTQNQQKERRGSDSSSDGFRDALGAEKWYIGGRTAAGEEKFYKLSMVKKPRSMDRLSFDRVSM